MTADTPPAPPSLPGHPAPGAPQPRIITRTLNRLAQTGDPPADQVYLLVYAELHRLAHRELAREHAPRTINTTVLVHEAFLRLTHDGAAPWDSRYHFYGAAARAMRRILVDAARRRKINKRAMDRLALEAAGRADDASPPTLEPDVLALDAALTDLESLDPRLAEVVLLRYYAGLSVEQTADVLQTSETTVKRDWRKAKAWLYDRLARDLAEGAP